MTDTTITPVVAPEATPDIPPPTPPEQKPEPTTPAVEHTPGGWPVVPLAVTGTNTGTSLVAAAALVGGGPAALAVAATGAAVLGTVAVARKHRDKKKPRKTTTNRTSRTAAGLGSTGRGSGSGRVPGQARGGTASIGKSAGRGRGKSGRGSAGSALGFGAAGRPKNSTPPTRKTSTKRGSIGAGAGGGKSGGRVGQVKALRDSARTSSPSRAARRSETAGARRSVADARRNAKNNARTGSLKGKGALGRAVGKAAGRISAAKGAAIERSRKARDRKAAGTVASRRDAVRKAPARKAARKALRRSAMRFQGRRLLAAVLAGALGLVGLVTTPLGRRLGWAWLMYPGRRLYARLMHTAEEQRRLRDEIAIAALHDDEAAVDAEAAEDSTEIGDTAERPQGPTPAAPTTTPFEGEIVSGFRFEEYAAEMEAAAQQYDPENAMEILAMVEGLPAALSSVANVMQILAERADSEFPLEKQVADGFNDIYGALMAAVAVAEDMGPLFRQAHEQDIARHEDPRNGVEAEKGWNV
ncbi:hypothetical protein ASD97_10435 [Streptomyces sp. Root63]|uniref:hypothetical protein n=1 Tax=unclassified Streptomyces TaxID=2593676 RepID=UPI0006F4DB19|nr:MULTISPECIES: hypothetical protein [unclassified Streptomyces]KQX36929.1 hypothetical protein ASD29_06795 [Streptomyces sp. Root1295]KRA44009.1 hypothetical protein ASD97_10435 [Streptomyces sp. Root63]